MLFNRALAQTPDRPKTQLAEMIALQSKVQQVIKRSVSSVVSIGQTGSGVIISPSGIVLTVSHVTKEARQIVEVQLSDGRMVSGITLGANFKSDTGVIRLLQPGPYPFAPVSDKLATPGTWCVSMGYPLSFPRGTPAVARLGRVLRINETMKIVTDCTIMGGDSGGPLLNVFGEVIGINSSVKLDIDQNLHVSTPQFIKDWESNTLLIDEESLPVPLRDRIGQLRDAEKPASAQQQSQN